jgi:hypothetical protein
LGGGYAVWSSRLATVALPVLCLAWLLPGLIGHAPWKGGDGSSFVRFLGLWHDGRWLAPGFPYEAYPPLYSWLAAATAWLSSPLLALPDGARLASGVCIALALWFSAQAARELYDDSHRWAGALGVIGSVGLLLRGHEMNAYTAQAAGVAMLLAGLARVLRSTRGGWLAAAGLIVMLLATGLAEPLALALLLPLLPLASPAYRSATAKRGLLIAFAVAALAALLWIGVLWSQQIDLVQALQLQRWLAWLQTPTLASPQEILNLLPWYVWPSWPLAGWALYQQRRRWREPASVLPVLSLLLLIVVFAVSANTGEDKVLALVVPAALLAAPGLMTLRRGAAYALLWFSVMLFGFLGCVFWVYWSAHDLGVPIRLAQRLGKLGVVDIGILRSVPLAIGLAVTLIWLVATARVPRSPLRPLVVWTLGISFVWALLLGLFLDQLDPRLGYTRVATVLQREVAADACISARAVRPQARALLEYHSRRDLRAHDAAQCAWLLVQTARNAAPPAQDKRWHLQQHTQRLGDREDQFWLYVRTP